MCHNGDESAVASSLASLSIQAASLIDSKRAVGYVTMCRYFNFYECIGAERRSGFILTLLSHLFGGMIPEPAGKVPFFS